MCELLLPVMGIVVGCAKCLKILPKTLISFSYITFLNKTLSIYYVKMYCIIPNDLSLTN